MKRYQASNGLAPTGIVDKRTIAALNIPAASRLKQLKANLARLTEHSKAAGKRYVVVNIPAAQIEAVEGDRIVTRHAGVVGKPDRPTPILNSAIHELNFNAGVAPAADGDREGPDPQGPGHGAPQSKRARQIHIDAYGGDGKKLDPNKINWSSPATKNLTYKQQPGPENPLGFVKINFHNAHSVYMHDTPSQSLFGRNFRAASSGCVRVQGIEQLAAWVLADQGWRPEHVLADEEERRAPRRDAEEAGAAVFRLHHGLGDGGRRRPVPPRPLPEGRHRRDGCRLLRPRRRPGTPRLGAGLPAC